MLKNRFAIGLAAALGSVAALAAGKPEAAIHYRQAVYEVIVWNFGPMNQMAKGKQPWNAAEFALRADRVASLAPQLMEGFPQGSATGAKTEAKPEIWTNMADFKTKMDAFVTESKALSDLAKGGDEAKMKAQFAKVADTCKSCHDKYKVD